MSMELSIQRDGKYFRIFSNGTYWGSVYQDRNPYHAGNIYLHYTLEPGASLSPDFGRDLFRRIHQELDQPLQILLGSGKTDISTFLEAGGFQRVRRTYCMEVWPECIDFPMREAVELLEIGMDSPIYAQCTKLLYRQYADKHAAINPLTADFATFCTVLPEKVFCQEENGQIVHFAFVDENEIAYVGSTVPADFTEFAASLVASLFREYEDLYFEADDCDAEAMTLRTLFADSETNIFDTYIRQKHRT